MLLRLCLLILCTPVCYVLIHIARFLSRELFSPLRYMCGPPNASLFFGNFREMLNDLEWATRWRAQFGHTFRIRGVFSISEVYTTDVKALSHILNDNTTYRRSPVTRDVQQRLLGNGVLYAEKEDHKRQRRVMNQAFGAAQIRLLTDVFAKKATQLREIWATRLNENGGRIDVTDDLRRMTLDVIGQAGFHYAFDALNEKRSELNDAFTSLLHSPGSEGFMAVRLVQSTMPILKLLPLPGSKLVLRTRAIMDSIGAQIVSTTKAALMERAQTDKVLHERRDLLAVLLKSNLSTDLRDYQRMSDEEVIAQIPTFLLAGHETTSSAVTWALHELSQNPDVQQQLREELFTLGTEEPTMDELNSLRLLERIVRETLRLHAPVVFLTRMAMQDNILPLSRPYIDRDGKEHYNLPIAKGQMMHIPILAVNTDKKIWGDDALEFKPQRWDALPEAVNGIPGVWANLLTFFAGPHACIGFRFSLVEIKVLLFTLLRAFEFDPAVSAAGIVPKVTGLIQNPVLRVSDKSSSTFPLILKPYSRE
ncbi:cytochrome P450 [Roridomyces roridus]|uniref:Cytochrome P450 n=1 Tax=Roridomyces roridus TaxID=1738132 RepID=A0AAD7BBJ8_9AGAR|nr:cytochrome P450 [Roridomyces roridus]